MKRPSLDCSVEHADLKGKRVLMRVDVNVPFDDNGNVVDHERIIQTLPTINYILYSGAKQLILMSHHGRPHGKRDPEQSLAGVAKYFREQLAYDIHFVPDCIMDSIPDKKLILLENLRFHIGEETNDPAFARKLASYADVYVNDAFGSYQPHASVVDIPRHLPSYCGFLFQKEIQALSVAEMEHPVVLLLGGDKASTKLPMIERLASKADHILIGGVLTFYFLAAQGIPIGKSKFTPEYVPIAKPLLRQRNVVLPEDLVAAKEPKAGTATRVCAIGGLRDDEMGLDIGPATCRKYKEILASAKTIIWNGPMGLVEIPPFNAHTDELARFLTEAEGATIVGGGDSITVINRLGIESGFDYISTGGGATLEFLRTGTHPGLEALKVKVTR